MTCTIERVIAMTLPDLPREGDISMPGPAGLHSAEHFRERASYCRNMAEVTCEPLRGTYLAFAERYAAAAADAEATEGSETR
jgi:hypothetical protein